MMNKKRFVGFALVLAGILMSLSRVALTGAVIGEPRTALLDFTTASITIVGIIMIIAAEEEGGLEKRTRNLAKEIDRTLREGGVGTSDDLMRYATQLGLRVAMRGGSHAIVSYPNGGYMETIPMHGKDIGKGIYRKILRKFLEYAETAA